MICRQLVRPDTGCCTYVIGSESSHEFVIVDPLMDLERFMEPVVAAKGKVMGIVDTHIHANHLSGSRELQRSTGAPIFMHESSLVKYPFTPLSEGRHNFAGLRIEVIHTPGHAPEHICLLIGNAALLTGDCLLVRDVGRTDLGRGSPDELYLSLFKKLLVMDSRVEIFPAHVGKQHYVAGDTKSTISAEKTNNPALQVKSIEEFREYMSSGWPPKPRNYELFVKVNSGELELGAAQELAKVKQGELYTE